MRIPLLQVNCSRAVVSPTSFNVLATAILVLLLCVALPNSAESALQNFDICLQDGTSGNLFQINSDTGQYRFTKCIVGNNPSGSSLIVNGTGSVAKKGSVLTLQDSFSDRRVRASVDRSANRGIASVQVFSSGVTESISDRDLAGHACNCPPPVVATLDKPAVIVPLYEFPLRANNPCSETLVIPNGCYKRTPTPCLVIDPPDPFALKPRGRFPLPKITPCECPDQIPDGQNLSLSWQKLIAFKKIHTDYDIWAIVNPSNGPGKETVLAYKIGICQLKEAGIKVLGYVCTKFAGQNPMSPSRCECESTDCTSVKVTVAQVNTAVDTWKMKYGLDVEDGIFFDEMANDDGMAPGDITRTVFYKSVGDHARYSGLVGGERKFSLVVGNPGSISPFVDSVDTMVIYEKPLFPTETPGQANSLNYASLPVEDPGKWAILAYDVASLPKEDTEDFKAARKNVKYIYATDDCFFGLPTCMEDPRCLACKEDSACSKCMANAGITAQSCPCRSPWDQVPSGDYLTELFRLLSGA